MSKELTEAEKIHKALRRPFPEKKISWRVGATSGDKSKGIALAYIDARDVMERLDDVLGTHWQCKYSHAENKTICELGIEINGEWIWRAGGAGDTDVEAEKGAISDAFKRAAVLFGIGRYLYSLTNNWCVIEPAGRSYKLKSPPQLPEWATPMGFDKGLTPDGPIFGENRMRFIEGVAEEVTGLFGKDDDSKQRAYEAWSKAIPEFKMIEEQNYCWFLLDSDIRSAIKRIQAQVNQLLKAA